MKLISHLLTMLAFLSTVSCGEREREAPYTDRTSNVVEKSPRELSERDLAELDELAKSGHNKAAYLLHVYHTTVSFTPPRAGLLEQAARGGLPEAQCSYYTVLMMSPSQKVREGAVIWLEAAAKQGYKPAEEGLREHAQVLELTKKKHEIRGDNRE